MDALNYSKNALISGSAAWVGERAESGLTHCHPGLCES